MTDETIMGEIRAKVICIFRNENRILVMDVVDPGKGEQFYCPAGGGIEFGETSEAALRREMKEELKADIENPILLGVVENIFTYAGQKGHEIVFVYDAIFADQAFYGSDLIEGRESNGETYHAIWLDLNAVGPDTPPVYPDGLLDILKRT